jgi:tetratricopeptide (TPR) repeat protein
MSRRNTSFTPLVSAASVGASWNAQADVNAARLPSAEIAGELLLACSATPWQLAVPPECRLVEAHRHDVLASDAWTLLTKVTAETTRQPKLSELWARRARAALARIGGDSTRRARLLHATGLDLYYRKQYAPARDQLAEALALIEAGDGAGGAERARHRPDPVLMADVLLDAGTAAARLGKYDDALTEYRRAREVLAAVAPEHPMIATALATTGWVYKTQGRLDQARDSYERSLEIKRAAYPPDSLQLAITQLGLAVIEARLGRHRSALGRIAPGHPTAAASGGRLRRGTGDRVLVESW